ncbi:MAG: DNA repair protein RecN [Firmicutes bacterium]|nr:DNA repair protein RecN [Bacillota bacterium]
MIEQLSIQNFAIIKDLQADFSEGLNIITGETGAGKSIIIEAIHMALGGRADSSFVRTGAKKARIQLEVTTPEPVRRVLLTREISENGRSTCRIDDEIVTLSALDRFCRELVDVHGQYDNQSLLDPEQHIRILDTFDARGGLTAARQAYDEKYHEFQSLQQRLNELNRSVSEALRKKDFMAFELAEIQKADLKPGEDLEIGERLTVLQHSEQIFTAAENAYNSLYAFDGSASADLSAALNALQEIAGLSEHFAGLHHRLEDCYYQIEEIAGELSRYRSSMDYSPNETDELIRRQETIKALKMKYGSTVEEILSYGENLRRELFDMDNYDGIKKDLVEKTKACGMELLERGRALSRIRQETARQLEAEVNRELSELSFKDSDFQVRIDPRETGKGKIEFAPDGIDRVEFFITTNKGEAHKPVSKIASGGEISRIMLAFKKILGDYHSVPTYIFDEIDTGISGNAAAVVGRKLAQIAQKHQIICITHLPQIAVMGDAHYLIDKHSDDRETYTSITEMDDEALVREIARLSGNTGLTETALENAREMIRNAK